jgi:phage-related protein
MADKRFIRDIFYYRHYYLEFIKVQPEKVQKKFNWTLELIATIDHVPGKYFKHMEGTGGLYEIRVEVDSNIYRAFSFFDEGRLIVVANAFQKKSQKTPKNEIALAKKIKNEYFNEKENK